MKNNVAKVKKLKKDISKLDLFIKFLTNYKKPRVTKN